MMKFSKAAISLFLSAMAGMTVTEDVSAFSLLQSQSSRPLLQQQQTRLRMSTLAPPESQSLTSFDDNDENDNDGGSSSATTSTASSSSRPKKQKQQQPQVVVIDKESFYPPQTSSSAATTSAPAPSSSSSSTISSLSPAPVFGPLSMGFERLVEELGGRTGRAQLVWDCYKVGIDPSNLHGDIVNLANGWEDYETILSLLPTCRRSQRLSQSSVEKLEHLFEQQQQAQAQSQSQSQVQSQSQQSQQKSAVAQQLAPPQHPHQIENGVATLSYISRSNDGTTKLLLKLVDGLQVECVIIPWKNKRSTLCISSQVGCRQGCTFCATGRMGKLRNLSADEILAQMFFSVKMCRLEGLPEISNVVFMGMGEPSDNTENVVQATKMLTARELYQLAASRVTISTVGPTPSSFMDFAQSPCILAWSVHAVNDDLRKKLVPTTKYSMAELRQGLIDALLTKPMNARTVMLEVALMKGVNDQLEHADELAQFTQVIVDSVPGVKPHINLIPYNDIGPATKKVSSGISTPPVQYERPDSEDVTAFLQRLQSLGMYAHVRSTRGDDKIAACGQLATKKQNSKTMKP
eukprot:CAMPEP_0113482488 /NCGR_PEP_ID=MMETSP0014_2-20120614/22944_1 /TAXON_ID=2857 /ORGANISM="Nitzschia sp." /LENGTH=575 /DNA_ID=CAMNT_0000376005 /DNA_START=329 /DNA_END=2056 /DNA_ORIENTATION=- /assembly_acc=CAM_ASM_000159